MLEHQLLYFYVQPSTQQQAYASIHRARLAISDARLNHSWNLSIAALLPSCVVEHCGLMQLLESWTPRRKEEAGLAV